MAPSDDLQPVPSHLRDHVLIIEGLKILVYTSAELGRMSFKDAVALAQFIQVARPYVNALLIQIEPLADAPLPIRQALKETFDLPVTNRWIEANITHGPGSWFYWRFGN